MNFYTNKYEFTYHYLILWLSRVSTANKICLYRSEKDDKIKQRVKWMTDNGEKSFNKETGARLKKLRKEAKVNQDAVAKAAGCTPNYISLIERGKCRLSAYILMAYVNTLGISPNRLLGFDDNASRIKDTAREISMKAEDLLKYAEENL